MQGQVLPLAACRALGTESGTGDWRPSGYTAVMTRPEASADIPFQLHSPYRPAGDQPQAIRQLVEGFEAGLAHQTLLGVTGSGKTYTIANVVQAVQKPTLVLAPNKTLAAQLYGEFKEFFPNNAVEYFVSYYDYYQPEAYVVASDTFNPCVSSSRMRALRS